jgi:hypothetical protein
VQYAYIESALESGGSVWVKEITRIYSQDPNVLHYVSFQDVASVDYMHGYNACSDSRISLRALTVGIGIPSNATPAGIPSFVHHPRRAARADKRRYDFQGMQSCSGCGAQPRFPSESPWITYLLNMYNILRCQQL